MGTIKIDRGILESIQNQSDNNDLIQNGIDLIYPVHKEFIELSMEPLLRGYGHLGEYQKEKDFLTELLVDNNKDISLHTRKLRLILKEEGLEEAQFEYQMITMMEPNLVFDSDLIQDLKIDD